METYDPNPETKSLTETIADVFRSANFGEGIEVVPVTGPAIVEEIRHSELRGLDRRSPMEGNETTASVFEGLDFDPERLRSQVVALYANIEGKRTPVALATIVIAPKAVIKDERYWEKTADGLVLKGFQTELSVNGMETALPDFVIEPAWTKVDPRFLGRFAITGFRTIKNALHTLEEKAPANTYIEIQAQGNLPYRGDDDPTFPELRNETEIGKVIRSEDLPMMETNRGEINIINIFGQNTEGSSSTVKMAKLLDVPRIENIAGQLTLGPVFRKQIK
ncbi:MAG: hypothetical protein NTY66_01045 [Candidatus Vogelbacteria bacterium]|nr:hypothetical protein [Candidatus Vogelbacteria bacterium]